MATRTLTERQKRFVEAYAACANASEAARQAGYKGAPDRIGPRLLGNVGVASAIEAIGAKRTSKSIADRKERHEFWSKVMRGRRYDLRERLKASELLGKAKGDFFERVEHSGVGGGPVQHLAAHVSLTKQELEEAVARALAKI